MTLSDEVEVLHIESENSSNSLRRSWPARAEKPARESKRVVPRLTVLHSPFRFVVQPIIDHVMHIRRQTPERTVAVLLPELIEPRWYQYFLHNQRARILAARLLTEGTDRIVIVNVPGISANGIKNRWKDSLTFRCQVLQRTEPAARCYSAVRHEP
jgi:hypothetical protein